MSDQKAATLERIEKVDHKTLSSLWHGMLRQLSYADREAWREAGYPSDPYAEEPCKFCKLLEGERQRERRHAQSTIAKVEQIAKDALARARRVSAAQPAAPSQSSAVTDLKELAEAVAKLTPEVNIQMPDPAPITVNIDRDLLKGAAAATLEYDENDVSVEQDGNVIRVKSNR